jgi:hypothetical protein
LKSTTRFSDLIPVLIAAIGTATAFTAGSAGGFEHTVALVRRNGSGAYWDIVTAVCVEILAVTGTAMWVVFSRRGWPTRYPLALVVLGVLLTFGAQMAYRAAPLPNALLGYVVAGTPTLIALLLILGMHLWYEYANNEYGDDRVDVAAVLEPGQIPEAEEVEVRVLGYAPETTPVPEPVPTPVPAVAPVAEPRSKAAANPDRAGQIQRVRRVRALPTSAKTGRPTVAAVRAEFGIGQDKAQKLIREAFEAEQEKAGGEEAEVVTDQSVEKDQDHLWEDEGGEAKEANERSHHCNSVDQGEDRPPAAEREPFLQVVGGH